MTFSKVSDRSASAIAWSLRRVPGFSRYLPLLIAILLVAPGTPALAQNAVATLSNLSVPYGSTTGVPITFTLSYQGSLLSGVEVRFLDASNPSGHFTSDHCYTNSSGACTLTYFPSGTTPVGVYSHVLDAEWLTGTSSTYPNVPPYFIDSNLTITGPAPGTGSISAVTTPFGASTGVSVTATETGTSGSTSGGKVTFSTASANTGTFSPSTCTLSSSGTCSVTFLPKATLAVGAYAGDLKASFAATGNYGSTLATNDLTVTALAPTVALASIYTYQGSTTPVALTPSETGVNGNVVSFALSAGIDGAFSSTTCVLAASGSSGLGCSQPDSYIPSGLLAAGTYANAVTANFAASGSYAAATAAASLIVTASAPVAPTVSLNPVTAINGIAQAIDVTATETGSNGAATGTATFSLAGGAVSGSFSPASCTLSSGSCTVKFSPSTATPVGTYANSIVATFSAGPNYLGASATSTLTVTPAPTETDFPFDGATGSGVIASLIQASDGMLYGTGAQGGAYGHGSVYKASTSGTISAIYSFQASNGGAFPQGGLIEGFDGALYGMTNGAGAFGNGTFFRITRDGTYTALYSFGPNDAQNPAGSLIQGPDGTFYGTTTSDGGNGNGAIFSVTTDGTAANTVETNLYFFGTAADDGGNPVAGLVLGTDGYLYGLTSGGGLHNAGVAFRISTDGTGYSILHQFVPGTDGANPAGSLVFGANGNLYGTAPNFGSANHGTVFMMTTSGTFTVLNNFSSTPNGLNPMGSLLLASDGNFYSTTNQDTVNQAGTVFEMSAAGSAQPLLYLGTSATSGSGPDGGVVQAADGSFYGTTTGGGLDSDGVIFQLIPTSTLPAPVQLNASSTSLNAGQTFTLNYTVANAYGATMSQCAAYNTAGDTAGWTGPVTGSPSLVTSSQLTASAVGGTYTYALTCGGIESNSVTVTVAPAAAPTVTAISPAVGVAAGGTSVTITGTNFTAATTVKFGTASAASVTYVNATSLVAVSPAGTEGAVVDITVSTTGGVSASSAADQFTYLRTPQITFTLPAHNTIDAPFVIAASTNSGGAISYTFVSGPASLSGSTVTLTGVAGLVQLKASATANGIYSAGVQTASFNVVAGSVWLANSAGSLSIFGSNGTALLNATGGGVGTITNALSEAFDTAGTLWVASTNGVSTYSEKGIAAQSTAYTGGGISSPVSLALDGTGYVWIVNANTTVSVLNSAGMAVSPAGGYQATGSGLAGGMAVDVSGSVWVTNQSANTLIQFVGAAAPVAPASVSLLNGTAGVRP